MSKLHFVTVSDDRFGRKAGQYASTQKMVKDMLSSADHLKISDLFFWKFDDILKTDFYKKNRDLIDNPNPDMNGRCYKPFVILDSLQRIGDGDFLIYNDISPEHWIDVSFDSEFIDTDVIKDLCDSNKGILSSEVIWIVNNEVSPHTHENFTTEMCIETMNMRDYRYSIQHASGMMVLRKNKTTIDFVREWLKWNSMPECASLSSLDGSVNYYDSKKLGHRHDQSISGLLINSMNGKIVKYIEGYNFTTFCRKNFPYQFIETNQGPSEYVYKILNGSIIKDPRDPEKSSGSSNYPLNL